MAFSGLHVVCAYAGSMSKRDKSQPIMGDIRWSESPSSGAPTTNAAPNPSDSMGDPMFRIYAAADSWVAVGANPDETTNPRFLVPAATEYDVFVEPGDKLAWVAA